MPKLTWRNLLNPLDPDYEEPKEPAFDEAPDDYDWLREYDGPPDYEGTQCDNQ